MVVDHQQPQHWLLMQRKLFIQTRFVTQKMLKSEHFGGPFSINQLSTEYIIRNCPRSLRIFLYFFLFLSFFFRFSFLIWICHCLFRAVKKCNNAIRNVSRITRNKRWEPCSRTIHQSHGPAWLPAEWKSAEGGCCLGTRWCYQPGGDTFAPHYVQEFSAILSHNSLLPKDWLSDQPHSRCI